MLDRPHELAARRSLASLRHVLPSVIEVDEHHDTGFRGHASERDKSHRDYNETHTTRPM